MTLRTLYWFGEPWPSAEERAPVCDDEHYRLDPAPAVRCIDCEQPILAADRGLATPLLADGIGGGRVFLVGHQSYCAYHIDCWIAGTCGPELRGLIARTP